MTFRAMPAGTLVPGRFNLRRIGQEIETRQRMTPPPPPLVPADSRLSLGPITTSRKNNRLRKPQNIRPYFPQGGKGHGDDDDDDDDECVLATSYNFKDLK